MVYEHFSRCFIPKDSSSRFLELFLIVVVLAHGDIPKLVALMLEATKLFAIANDTNGIRHITVGEMFFWLINHSIVLRLRRPFQEHISPHQFGKSTPGSYEAIPFGIGTFFNLHLNWAMMQVNIKNGFNSIFQATIFRELCDVEGPLVNIVPFTKLFYGVHFSF